MIEVHDLHRHFGGFRAVDGASLQIRTGSITGLIGPNGAGKSTLFNVIAGVLPPTSGRVLMDGEDITGLPPHELFHKGLLRTFQMAHEFSSMSVRENLMMVPGAQSGETIWKTWFQRGRIEREEADAGGDVVGGILDGPTDTTALNAGLVWTEDGRPHRAQTDRAERDRQHAEA